MKKGIDCVGIFTAGISHDGNGNVLFRRRGPGARDERGKWDPGVGGSLDHGEALEDSLRREFQEEVNTEPLSMEFLGSIEKFRTLEGVETHWIGFFYKCLIDPEKVVLDGQEADELIWSPFDQYPDPMMIGFEDTFEKFRKHFQ